MRDEPVLHPIETGSTLKRRTVELITDAILSGELTPGQRVNESHLARQLHVSRSPIREALQQLQEQSLIVNIPRRGMFVVTLGEDDIQKINSLRIVLEAETLRLARRNLTAQREKQLEQLLARMETATPSATKLCMKFDFEFHRTIWRFGENEYLEKVLTGLATPVFAYSVRQLLRSETLKLVLDSHRPLFEFICGDRKKTAEQVMLDHLSVRYYDPDKYSSLHDSSTVVLTS